MPVTTISHRFFTAASLLVVAVTLVAAAERKVLAASESPASRPAESSGPPAEILGTWTFTTADHNTTTYTFTKDGKFNWRATDRMFAAQYPDGLNAKFEIVKGTPCWTIDIHDFDQRAYQSIYLRGIIQWIDAQTMKIQSADGTPMDRPSSFDANALLMKKN